MYVFKLRSTTGRGSAGDMDQLLAGQQEEETVAPPGLAVGRCISRVDKSN